MSHTHRYQGTGTQTGTTHTGSHTGRRPVVSWVNSVLIWARTQHLPYLLRQVYNWSETDQSETTNQETKEQTEQRSRTFENILEQQTKSCKMPEVSGN